MPKDNADRVVEGAQHLSPNLGERMVAARLMAGALEGITMTAFAPTSRAT